MSFVLLLAVTAVAWWVLLSPVRAAAVPALVVAAPSTPPVVLAVIGAVLVAGAGCLVWRALAESGWWLVTVTRPPALAGGGR